jgi:hypothetical protein
VEQAESCGGVQLARVIPHFIPVCSDFCSWERTATIGARSIRRHMPLRRLPA